MSHPRLTTIYETDPKYSTKEGARNKIYGLFHKNLFEQYPWTRSSHGVSPTAYLCMKQTVKNILVRHIQISKSICLSYEKEGGLEGVGRRVVVVGL